MAIFFIELSASTAALIDLQADLGRLRQTASETTGSANPVAVLQAAYIPVLETCISLIDGADQDSVRQVLHRAGVRAHVLPAVALN